MTSAASTLVVPRRFRGPATSGNGGWTAGALASLLPKLVPGTDRRAPVQVRLSAPPPLETPMDVMRTRSPDVPGTAGLRAVRDGRTVLEATPLGEAAAQAALTAVEPVGHEAGVEAGRRYAGLGSHPFPECFACGTARGEGDGLRLRPGPVAGATALVAAVWTPDESVLDAHGVVPVPILWAALDCPGGWSVDIAGRPMVLGTMTARVLARPEYREPCVVTARAVGSSPRKALTATTLYGAAGDVLALAAHVWIAIDPAAFGRREGP